MSSPKAGIDQLARDGSDVDVFRADTVPPPASGDAYSAETVVREAPAEILASIKKRKDDALAFPEPPVPSGIRPHDYARVHVEQAPTPYEPAAPAFEPAGRAFEPAPRAFEPVTHIPEDGRVAHLIVVALWAFATTAMLVAAILYIWESK